MTRRLGLNRWGCAVALGFAILVSGHRQAVAVPTCFPPGGGGVPGQPGLPDWWSGSAPFDDPRWIGAYGFGHGTVKFDAMVDPSSPKAVILKWRIKPDPGVAAAGDQIWVGFFNTTTTVATALKFTRDALVTTTAGGVGAGVMSATAFTRTGATGLFASATVPTNVGTKARLDAFCTTADPILCDEWIVRLRVPTTAAAGGIDLGDTFKMWYQVDVEHGGTTDRAKWPNTAADLDGTADPLVFPEPSTWNDVKIGGAGTCAAGIDITYSDITVSNSKGAGTDLDVNSANTFHVKPINNTTTVYNPNSIKSLLRLADWGSAVGDSPRWIPVPDPSCASATGTGAAGSITGGTRFDLTCTWSLTAGQKCAYRPDLFPGCTPDPGPRYHHQCIMADLSSAAGPIAFSTDSAWNNFDFGHASKLERKARLDIGTLGPRDVYVYIATQNMPDKVSQDPPKDTPPKDTTKDQPGDVSPAVRERNAVLGNLVPGRVGQKEAAALSGLVAAGRLTYDDVARVMPTYTAYVWHDTGTKVKTSTGLAALLAPQPSFTLFVSHDGPLVGWQHALTGVAGATVTEVSKNFYRIAVSASGTVEVLTTVNALEQDGPPPQPPVPPLPWWLIVLIALILFVVISIVRRLRRP